jgi:phosphohistidine swiveling domain-containing protein
MKHKKGLISKYKKEIFHNEWYNQRFDGSPQFLGLLSFPHFWKYQQRPPGTHFTDLLGFYNKGIADWYINIKDIRRITRIFIKQSKRGKNIGQKLISEWEPLEKKFYQKCQEIKNLDISSLENKIILKHYQELVSIYQDWFSMSSIIDGFALGSDDYLYKMIDSFLKNKGIEKGRGSIFSKLTNPTVLSFSKEAEISLLKIASQISKIKKLKEFFHNNSSQKIEKEIKVNYSRIYKLLEQHQQNFFWLRNNYIYSEVISIQEFIIEIKDILRSNVSQRLSNSKNQVKKNKKEKKDIIEKFNFPLQMRNLIEISESFTSWQDQRKKSTFFAIHYLSLLLKEFAQRTKYSLEDFKFFMVDEVVNLIQNKANYPSKKEIKERKSFSVFYHRGNYYDFFTGEKSKKLFKQISQKKKSKRVDDFRGLTASSGIEVGKVKIVKTVQDIYKVQNGDVLVSIMTRPDYIMGIKKASAIITDEGGVTCHAAIVSRELGIPCIIATKNATQILKDGDLVEVDADHGVVKILNKK